MADEILAGTGAVVVGEQYVTITLAVPATMVGTVYRTVGEVLEAQAFGDVLDDDPDRGHSRR